MQEMFEVRLIDMGDFRQRFVGTVDQEIELFNYDAGQFETVDTRLTSATDSVIRPCLRFGLWA